MSLPALTDLDPARFETAAILKQLNLTSRRLAELKGVVAAIPNQTILINTLGMQEAKDSSEIENIVTTHDELYRDDAFPDDLGTAQAKEVLRYRQALQVGFQAVRERGLLTNNHILAIQAELECNNAGFRKVPGTVLRNAAGDTVYTPPLPDVVPALMHDLEGFINDDAAFPADPLIKMALIHHQFESIHPFYDGNGRTGRIINVLYLVQQQLLTLPVLYLSRQLVRSKADYYHGLQGVRERDAWEDWVLYMLRAVASTAAQSVQTITAIRGALQDYKQRIRQQHRFYSQDLINNLFSHPYTKIQFLEQDLGVSRITATKYLNALVDDGFLARQRLGRGYYYVNLALYDILTDTALRVSDA